MTIHYLFKLHSLVPLIYVCVAHATVIQTFYKTVNSGETITGQWAQEVASLSVRECSVRLVRLTTSHLFTCASDSSPISCNFQIEIVCIEKTKSISRDGTH